MNLSARILGVIERAERVFVVLAFAVLSIVLFFDVLSRELTAAGVYWAPQVGVWANVILVMAGFGLASAGGTHLRPRFADGWLPQKWEPVLVFLQHFVMALFCAALGLVALDVVIGSWRLGEVSLDLFLPIWPVQAFLPLAFFTAALKHALYAFYPSLRPSERGAFDTQLGEQS